MGGFMPPPVFGFSRILVVFLIHYWPLLIKRGCPFLKKKLAEKALKRQ
jgi:hypothetical protein